MPRSNKVKQFKYAILKSEGYWDSERRLPKAKQSIKKQESFVRNKANSTEQLRNISSYI